MRSGRSSNQNRALWVAPAPKMTITNKPNRSFSKNWRNQFPGEDLKKPTDQSSDDEFSQNFREGLQRYDAQQQYINAWNDIGRHHTDLIYANDWRDESPLDDPKYHVTFDPSYILPPVPSNPRNYP